MRRFKLYLALMLGALAIVTLPGCGRSSSTGKSPASGKARDLITLGEAELDQDGEVVSLTLYASDATDVELQQLASFSHLRSLSLQECKNVTDKGLEGLKTATNLAKLQLIRVDVTDDGLRHVSSAKALADLRLAHTKVIGHGLKHLAGLPVAKLSFHSLVATPEGLSSLAELTSLKELELECRQLKFNELTSLSSLNQLESLVTVRTEMGANGLDRFRGISSLQRLTINARGVDDAAIETLNTLVGLTELGLVEADITDDGLSSVTLPNVTHLALKGCAKITDAGLANLGGFTSLSHLDVAESCVSGVDLTGLACVPTLRELTMSGEQFKGNDDSLAALKKLLPECDVQILRG